jgi:glycosyltransferase involved in cell wall biosynthesis
MKIVLVSTFVPFVRGGYRFIVEWLEQKLQEHGHEVERIYLPFVERPDALLEQMVALRLIDLSDKSDILIGFRPPAYLLPHPNKVLWFIHHMRVYYDLWDTEYSPVPNTSQGRALRHNLMAADQVGMSEARRLFTNSKVVSERVRHFNNLDSEVLYPPLLNPEDFHCDGYSDEIVYMSRVEHHKRQHLVVEAMAHTRTAVKLRLCGLSSSRQYADMIGRRIDQLNLRERVSFENRWISDAEKIEVLSRALAVTYLPIDEDSYGYPSLEAGHARKLVITTNDAGGVPELIVDGLNGYVCDPDPKALAEAFDRVFLDRQKAIGMGMAAQQRIADLNISWDHVIGKLLS